MSNLHEVALHYLELGLHVFPLVPNKKVPYNEGSLGCWLMNESKERLLTKQEVSEFWTLHPNANIGCLPAGLLSVIDVDNKNQGNGSGFLIKWGQVKVLTQGLKILSTSSDSTGSHHLYFQPTDKLPDNFNSYERYGQKYGIDIRNGTSGYFLLPPSRTPEGSYRFTKGLDPLDFNLSLLPPLPCNTGFFHRLPTNKFLKENRRLNNRKRLSTLRYEIKELEEHYSVIDGLIDKYEYARESGEIVNKQEETAYVREVIKYLKGLEFITFNKAYYTVKKTEVKTTTTDFSVDTSSNYKGTEKPYVKTAITHEKEFFGHPYSLIKYKDVYFEGDWKNTLSLDRFYKLNPSIRSDEGSFIILDPTDIEDDFTISFKPFTSSVYYKHHSYDNKKGIRLVPLTGKGYLWEQIVERI